MDNIKKGTKDKLEITKEDAELLVKHMRRAYSLGEITSLFILGILVGALYKYGILKTLDKVIILIFAAAIILLGIHLIRFRGVKKKKFSFQKAKEVSKEEKIEGESKE